MTPKPDITFVKNLLKKAEWTSSHSKTLKNEYVVFFYAFFKNPLDSVNKEPIIFSMARIFKKNPKNRVFGQAYLNRLIDKNYTEKAHKDCPLTFEHVSVYIRE